MKLQMCYLFLEDLLYFLEVPAVRIQSELEFDINL